MTHPNRTANRDLSDYLDLALRLANLFPALLDFETGEIGPDLVGRSRRKPAGGHAAASGGLGGRDPSEDRPARDASWAGCLAGRVPLHQAEYRVRRHDGLWVWIKVVGKVVERDSGGQPLRLALAVRNIDDLRQAEQQLVESERRYRELYEEAPNAYVAIGGDRRLLSVNHRATQLLGVPASELVGRPVLAHFAETPAGRPRAEESLRAGFAGRETSGRELEMCRRYGGALWVSVWMRPLRGDDGRIAVVHSIWVDITARVAAAAERARLQQQNLYLQEEIKSVHNFEEIVGRSPELLAVLDKVSR